MDREVITFPSFLSRHSQAKPCCAGSLIIPIVKSDNIISIKNVEDIDFRNLQQMTFCKHLCYLELKFRIFFSLCMIEWKQGLSSEFVAPYSYPINVQNENGYTAFLKVKSVAMGALTVRNNENALFSCTVCYLLCKT